MRCITFFSKVSIFIRGDIFAKFVTVNELISSVIGSICFYICVQ